MRSIIFILLVIFTGFLRFHPITLDGKSARNISHSMGVAYADYTAMKDRNQNNISDYLELELKNNDKHYLDFLIATTQSELRKIKAMLEKLAIREIEVYHRLNIIHAYAQKAKLKEILGKIARKAWIEENSEVYLSSSISLFPPINGYLRHGIGIEYNGSKHLTVGIIDTGVCVDNPWLSDKVVYFKDITGESQSPIDLIGHGTMVASIIAARKLTLETPPSFVSWGIVGTSEHPPIAIYIERSQIVSLELNAEISNASLLVRVVHENSSSYEFPCKTFPARWNISLSKGLIKIYVNAEEASEDVPYVIHITLTRLQNVSWGGLAPNVKLAVWKVFEKMSFKTDVAKILKAINDLMGVYKQLNITILNLSISTSKESVILNTAVDQLVQRGILVVVAAGNDYTKYGPSTLNQIRSPGSAKYAITVAALNEKLGIAIYSSRGGSYGEYFKYTKPDISAVGGGLIYGSWVMAADSDDSDFLFDDEIKNDFSLGIGTSFAAAYISGVLALITSRILEGDNWEWSLEQALCIKAILLGSAFETTYLGIHETLFSDITRSPPPLSHGEKDYDEGFGAVFPAEAFKIATQRRISNAFKAETVLNSSYPVFGLLLSSDDLIRIDLEMSKSYGADLVIYDISSPDGSPSRYWVTSKSDSKTFLGIGNMLIVIKLYLNNTIHIRLKIRILAERESIIAIAIGIGFIVFILVIYSLYYFANRLIRLAKKLRAK